MKMKWIAQRVNGQSCALLSYSFDILIDYFEISTVLTAAELIGEVIYSLGGHS